MTKVIQKLRKLCEQYEKGLIIDQEFALEVTLLADDAWVEFDQHTQHRHSDTPTFTA
jgi:hypothetical protein